MNPFIIELLTSTVRSVVLMAGSVLVTYGVISEQQVGEVNSALTTIVVGALMVIASRAFKSFSLIKGASQLEALKTDNSSPITTRLEAEQTAKAVLGQEPK